MPSAQNRAETPDPSDERPSRVQRLRALPIRAITAARRKPLLFLVLLSGGSIIIGSAVSVVYYQITHRPMSECKVTIPAALALLDAGDYETAKQMSLHLRAQTANHHRKLSCALFIEGAALAEEATNPGHAERRQTLNLVAARYLEEARDRGFPRGREQQGLYLLATCLFNAGHFAESLPVLQEAFDTLPDQKYDLARLLSTAYLRDSVPDMKQALHYNGIWLKNPALPKADRDLALLQRAEILLDSRDTKACHEVLKTIAEEASVYDQALVTLARVSILEGDQIAANSSSSSDAAQARYRAAIVLLERAQSKDDTGTTTRQSSYLLGVCYQKLDDRRAAAAAFESARRLHYRTPEALAATLSAGEIAQQEGQDGIALTMYLDVLEEAGIASLYENQWVSLSRLRGRLLAGQQQFTEDHQFETALTMADALAPTIPADEIASTKARTHEAWAEYLLEKANEVGPTSGEVTRGEARRQFRLAADQYRKLAELRFATPEYPIDLWKSGSCFMRGQSFKLAVQLLRQHLDNVPRKQAPQGLVNLGQCELALGHYHTAISILDDCITSFPKHPESYRARILASQAFRETGKLPEAKALLLDNLDHFSLTPRSHYWRQSLHDLGKLLFTQAMIHDTESRKLVTNATRSDPRQAGIKELQQAHALFQESIEKLREVVKRQPDGESSNEARYYIAEAYRHSADLPTRSLEIEPTQTRRNTLRQRMRSYLRDAARMHLELKDRLARKQNQTELAPIEQRILRNTYFAHAGALFSLEEYEQAISAYTAAANRYQHQPEALEALLQIASCYRHMGSAEEARGTLLQAEQILSRIRKDADFTKTTRYDRDHWKQLLSWLSQI